jgi:histidine triad (HIT) family protein
LSLTNRDSGKQLSLFQQNEPVQAKVAGCAFCGIARGEVKALKVYSDDHTVAFLDRKPLFQGHTLVIPVDHYETLPELPGDLIEVLFSTVQVMSEALPIALGADGTFVAINNGVSQSVPHIHVHVVPRRAHDGLRGFFWPRQSYKTEDQAYAVQEKIRIAVSDLAAKKRAKSI